MTVIVGKRLYQSSGPSDLARLVIACIDGGPAWFDWAIRDPVARYHFPDEIQLVAAIQTGLHDSPLTLLRGIGLAVGPAKLMTLPPNDLRVLMRAEMGERIDPVQLEAVLEAHDLMPRQRFVEARACLDAMGVTDAPVFQAPGLEDWRTIAELTRTIGNGGDPLSREAAAFAVDNAGSPAAFCDYHRFYRDCARVLVPDDATPDTRLSAASEALATLLPLTYTILDCPMVEGLVSPWEVRAAIGEWIATGRQIGFVRPSLAVGQILAHAGYRGQTGSDAHTLVRDYVAKAQASLAASEIERGLLGQDGRTVRYPLKRGGESIVVEQGPTGQITLRMFDPGIAVRN